MSMYGSCDICGDLDNLDFESEVDQWVWDYCRHWLDEERVDDEGDQDYDEDLSVGGGHE